MKCPMSPTRVRGPDREQILTPVWQTCQAVGSSRSDPLREQARW